MLSAALIAVLFSLPVSQALWPPLVEAATVPESVPTREELIDMATGIAHEHHLNVDHFLKTIECESQFDPQAVGDHGQSHGLVQIYAPAHPDISTEEANDPAWALNWMAAEWSADRAYEWSCWRSLYGAANDSKR